MMETKSEYKMTDLGEIPVEWEDTDFLNIFKSVPTKKHQIPNKDILDSGHYEVIDQGKDDIAGYSNQTEKLFEDVPAIIYGDHTTVVKYRNKPFILGADGTKLLKAKDYHNAKYCYYLLDHFNISSEGYKRHYSIVKEVKLPLTKNKKEQQKIAEILSTVDEQIEQTDQLIEKTTELKKGLMQQLLTKGIGHTEFKQSELGEIPVEWEVSALDSVLDIRDGTHDSPNYVKNGIPFLTSKNLGKGKLNFKEVNYITEEDHKKFSERSLVENGDILFGMIGTVGNPVIVDLPYSISIKNVALVKFHESNMNNKYVLEYLNSQNTIKQFKKESNGGVQKFIALGKIRKLKITVPSVKEQQKIADILSSVDKDIEGYKEEKSKYEELKKGLMQQLLTGKTRVKVD